MRNGERTIRLQKVDLLSKLKEHKQNHIEEYEKAVKAYKLEAMEQLNSLIEKAEKGERKLSLKLVEPLDHSKDYDNIIEMFKWEVEDIVELSQSEFRQYVLDDNTFSQSAKLSNSAYVSKFAAGGL